MSNKKHLYTKDREDRISEELDNATQFYIPKANNFIDINRNYILENYALLFKDLNDEKEILLDLIIPKINKTSNKRVSKFSLIPLFKSLFLTHFK